MVYLDYTANTPVDEEVLKSFTEAARDFIGNTNSQHAAGREASARMNEITTRIAELLEVNPSEIIYTSGATESNNLALKGMAEYYEGQGRHIITTPLEHSSVSSTLSYLEKKGYEVDVLRVQSDGRIDLNDLKDKLREDTIMVALTAVDSELGVKQPVQEVVSMLKAYPNAHLHVDATQAVGKIPLCLKGVDTFSFAPHKFYGLNGCGILVKRRGLKVVPLFHGGVSTTMYRSGTPALSLAAATCTALELALSEFDERLTVVKARNEFLRKSLSVYPKVRINSPADAVPHILNISVDNIKGTVFQRMLDEKGICVSVKSACSTDGMPSAAILAISGDRRNALSSFRISLSHLTSEEDIRTFLQAFDACCVENA